MNHIRNMYISQKFEEAESWKHKVIRESFEQGLSYMQISNKYRLSIAAICNEIEHDIHLKMLVI